MMTDTLAALIERIDKRLMDVREAGFDDVCVYHADWCQLRDALPVWRPIETKPDNVHSALITGGTYTLDDNLGGGLPCDFVVSATFDALYKEWRDGEFTYKPTHWMPLPTPPEEP